MALIEQAAVVQRMLRHFGLPTEVPEARPARAPPRRLDETLEDQSRGAPEFDAAGEGVASREQGVSAPRVVPVASRLFPFGIPARLGDNRLHTAA